MIEEYISANWGNWKTTIKNGIRIFFYASGALGVDMLVNYIQGPHIEHADLWALIGPGAMAVVRALEGYWRYHGDLPPVVKVDKATASGN